jgi:choline dehydrogenase-like flavoprotein
MAITPYDAVVVGSGAGGATAAYVWPAKACAFVCWKREGCWKKSGEYDGLWKINEYTAHLYTNPRAEPYDPSLRPNPPRSRSAISADRRL